MAFDKVVEARVWGVTNQNSDLRFTAGDSSGGTFTSRSNPLRGTLLWDDCMFVLHGVSVAGGATGGSYTVTVQTDAITGYTGLPIARATIGPLTANRVVMDNLHQSPGAPLPTHLFIDQTATGGGIWLQCHALAKQYRGTLGTPGMRTSERIIQGNMLLGNSSGPFSSDAGISADTTFTLGTSGSDMGMHRVRLWDRAFYWFVSNGTVAGTFDCDIVSSIGGRTFSIASTGSGGTMTTAGDKLPVISNFYGQSPNPTHIIITEVSAGGISHSRVVVAAKTGRGSQAKS